MTSNWN